MRHVFAVSLGVLGLMLAMALARADGPEHSYVGVKKCKTCHGKELYGDQITAWEKGPHARAFESLHSEQALSDAAQAGVEGPPSESEACLECHATAAGVPPQRAKYKLTLADGVQCESCHGAGADYRKKSVMSDRDRAIAEGLVAEPAELCGTCHNSRSPHWDPSRYTLADGTRAGFDYEQAVTRIVHPIPEDRRGRVAEIEKELKASGGD